MARAGTGQRGRNSTGRQYHGASMKNGAIGIAIGIAAIDALLSAFTALLLLALVMLRPTGASSAGEVKDMHVFLFDKVASAGNAVSHRLLLDIKSSEQPELVSIFETEAGLKEIKQASSLVKPGGSVAWYDCTSRDSMCTAKLMIVKPLGNWTIRFRVAESANGYGATFPQQIHVKARGLGASELSGIDQALDVGSQITLCLTWGAPSSVMRC
jgi:hypothetical protein